MESNMIIEPDLKDWQPPSETEMKILQARRERSDKISKLMGDYLLKGYKMLASNCPQCDTILLQTRQGVNYCVACSELDSDADKDDPVTSPTAALVLAREHEGWESTVSPLQVVSSAQPTARHLTTQSAMHQPAQQPLGAQSVSDNLQTTLREAFAATTSDCLRGFNTNAYVSGASAVDTRLRDGQRYTRELLDTMDWAASELRSKPSVEYSIQLCQLLKACAEAVSAVRTALNS